MSKSFFVFVFVPPIHHSPSLHSGAPQADQYAAYDHMMLSAETLSLTSPTSRWAWRWLKSSPPPSLGPVPPARLAPDKASPPAPPARLAPESWHGNWQLHLINLLTIPEPQFASILTELQKPSRRRGRLAACWCSWDLSDCHNQLYCNGSEGLVMADQNTKWLLLSENKTNKS